ncbi:DUF4309 domain-containing protein [Paenibacillus hamazuiensis]|uniref:DUF4309 domain-containing protein n=1 Tax=Paenibacillus hamazuiensis TaxID=2936508 RepID=UPI00200E25A8|nr:DUF4309 domain-containing protein [Paenibacillus hamazuiensis]
MGAIAPQTVKAFEKWVSPDGEQWFHIHSWQGNAWIKSLINDQYLDKEAAIKIAKQMDSVNNPQWNAEFLRDFQDEISKENRAVWKVIAVYPAENKMIVFIDAVTGKVLALTETEPPTKEEPIDQTERERFKPKLDPDFISTASQGKLKGIDVALGNSKQDLIRLLGEPDEIGIQDGEYLKYGNCFFYLNERDDRVHVIDVKIETPGAKIKELLGKPNYEGPNEAGIEEYVVGYEAGNYYLYFKFRTENAELGVLRFKNPKGGY